MKTFVLSIRQNVKKTISFAFAFLLLAFASNAQVGIINTIAGNGSLGYTGDGGQATAAEFDSPFGIVSDNSGYIYIADHSNNRIRKINTSTGVITTIAGTGNCCGNPGGFTGDGGLATAAEISAPYGLAVDDSNNIFIADGDNYCIREIRAATGIISTVAGIGTVSGFSGDGGQATAAEITAPSGVAVDKSGNIYIADATNQRIRVVTKATGIISTVAGNGSIGYTGDGGQATAAEFQYPYDVTLDTLGNMYIADLLNNCIRKVTKATGIISTVAGNTVNGFSGDGGQATSAEINEPISVTIDKSGNIFIGDQVNHCIREVNKVTGIISTVAGIGGQNGFTGDGGPATAAKLFDPYGIAFDTSGNFYITDDANYRIRKVTNYYLPVTNFSANYTTVCAGDLVHFTDLSSQSPTSWTWTFTGGFPSISTSQNPSVRYNTPGTYSVKLKVTNLAGSDSLTKTLYIHVNSLPSISISGNPKICNGPDILTAMPTGVSPFSYNWNNGGTYDTLIVHAANIYSVTVTDSNGCSATGSTNIAKDSVSGVNICFVTVDTASKHNIIVWDKTLVPNIDSFKVYYLDAGSHWRLLASQPSSAIGQYTDTIAINSPNVNTVRYCLTGVDSCRNEELLTSSKWQNTMYINQSPRGTFTWSGTGYLIQGNALPVLTYYLYRDNLANGNWLVIDSISGSQNTMSDPNFNSYPLARWYVAAKLNISGCPAAIFREESSNVTLSRSNQQGNVPSGITTINFDGNVFVYPNPANQLLNIKFGAVQAGTGNIKIMDVTGRIIMEQYSNVSTGKTVQLDISALSPGVYFAKLISGNSQKVVKFIKE